MEKQNRKCRKHGYVLRTWMLVIPENDEIYDTREEAEKEKEQSDLLFPDDIHAVVKVSRQEDRKRGGGD